MRRDITREDIARGIVFTPLIISLIYIGCFSLWDAIKNGFLKGEHLSDYCIGLLYALLFGLFFSYLGAIVIGLPLFFLFRFCKLNDLSSSLLAGAFTGAAIMAFLFMWIGSGPVAGAMIGFLIFLLLGALAGFVFWLLAFKDITTNPYARFCLCARAQ